MLLLRSFGAIMSFQKTQIADLAVSYIYVVLEEFHGLKINHKIFSQNGLSFYVIPPSQTFASLSISDKTIV